MPAHARNTILIAAVAFCCVASQSLSGGTPYLVKDINPNAGSDPMYLTKVGNRLFFAANDGVHGRELWVSDGTSQGTYMVVDLRSGPDWSDPVEIREVNGRAFFQARNAAGGLDLYVSDGTAAGTTILVNISDGAFYHQMEPLGNLLLFRKEGSSTNTDLWRSDGTRTPQGTAYVKDVRVNDIASSGSLVYLAGVGPGAAIPGFDLWKTDGTTAGTVMLADLEGALWLTDFDGSVIFRGEMAAYGREPWISDGTPEGTRLLKDINPGANWESDPAGFSYFEGIVLFSAFLGNDLELWRTDGTEEGTYRVKDINPSGSSGPGFCYNLDGTAIFEAFRPDVGYELWKTDGTSDGTVLLKDIRPGPNHSEPDRFAIAAGKLYFRADDGVHGKEMWVTDGTPEGTQMVADLNPGPGTGFAQESPVNINGLLYFTGGNPPITGELWALDTMAVPIPTTSTIGVGIMASLIGAAGWLVMRQRTKL